ncbi:hypothetical protein RRG08_022698 [Elysia crispata]|uniref:Uncharacterized protein n=1 Tax=Elysia crispata TaxID=231223 RepID=A0AAE0ZDY5_9GAST|nr:hypothetical protein RRG08_022698 [Elysia crispata]
MARRFLALFDPRDLTSWRGCLSLTLNYRVETTMTCAFSRATTPDRLELNSLEKILYLVCPSLLGIDRLELNSLEKILYLVCPSLLGIDRLELNSLEKILYLVCSSLLGIDRLQLNSLEKILYLVCLSLLDQKKKKIAIIYNILPFENCFIFEPQI